MREKLCRFHDLCHKKGGSKLTLSWPFLIQIIESDFLQLPVLFLFKRDLLLSHIMEKKKKKSSFSSIRNNLHRLNFERVSSEQKTNVKFNNSVKNNTVWLSAVLSLKHAPKKWLFKRGWCKGENFVFTNMFFHLLIKDFFLTIRAKGSVCSSFLHLQVQIKPWNNDFPLITLLGKV